LTVISGLDKQKNEHVKALFALMCTSL